MKTRNFKIKEQKGITLIALIVTIIILLILAGVAINAAIGQNGLFSKSKEAIEKHKEEAALEKVNMTLGEYMLDINAVDMPEEEKESHLLELLGNLGPAKIDGDHYEVIVDGYVFWVDKETGEITSKGPEKTVELTGIKIKEENKNITVNVGQTKLIEIEVEPEGASTRDIEYESSAPDIVEVKNGTITGKAEGTAQVTIKSKKNSSITETVNVTVKEIKLISITVDKTSLVFALGDTSSQQITATLVPEDATTKTIVWKTSNDKVATVDNKGNVTAIGKGTCTITVASEKDENIKAEVTVEVKEVEVESISIDSTLEVVLNEEKDLPTIIFNPENATDKTITWNIITSNPGGCITIDESTKKIIGKSVGTATITVTTANNKEATCKVTVVDSLDVAMSIADVKAAIQKDGLKALLGQKVAYNPEGDRNGDGTAKGTWRVFYYNTEEEWGDPAGTLYLKRDIDSELETSLTLQESPSTETIQKMEDFNPQWRDSNNADKIDKDNEKAVAWLYDKTQWTKYCDTNVSRYAIGGPSVEFFMKVYNIYKGSVELTCQIKDSCGYAVFADGKSDTQGQSTKIGSVEPGPKSLFWDKKSGWKYRIASPRNRSRLLCSGDSKCRLYR